MSREKKHMDKQQRADELSEYNYEIWINLMSHGSYEEIGKAVVDALMNAPASTKTLSRRIIVCGS
jgi:hypothetical protein